MGRPPRARAWAGLPSLGPAHGGLGQQKMKYPMGLFFSAQPGPSGALIDIIITKVDNDYSRDRKSVV